MKPPPKLKYKKLEVDFWDHSINGNRRTPVFCSIMGYLIEEKPKYLVVSPWLPHLHGQEFENSFHDNLEPMCILKANITKKRVIK